MPGQARRSRTARRRWSAGWRGERVDRGRGSPSARRPGTREPVTRALSDGGVLAVGDPGDGRGGGRGLRRAVEGRIPSTEHDDGDQAAHVPSQVAMSGALSSAVVVDVEAGRVPSGHARVASYGAGEPVAGLVGVGGGVERLEQLRGGRTGPCGCARSRRRRR